MDTKSESFALDDTYICDLDLYQWLKVNLVSNNENFKTMARCAHDSVIYLDNLIIFGGMNNQSYLGSSLFIISLNGDLTNDTNKINNYQNKLISKESINVNNSNPINFVLPIIK